MEINDRNTFTGCGWMRTELGLVGAKFVCYAVIYSYTQFSREQSYNLGDKFLAEWCGVDERTIRRYIAEFISNGLIKQTKTIFENSVLTTTDIDRTKCPTIVGQNVLPQEDKMSYDAHANILYNNILNIILNTSSSITRTQEKILDWLTDDEEYLKSNLRTNHLIDHDPTREEIADKMAENLKDFMVELTNQGVDIDIKGRLDTKKHFSNWLKKHIAYGRRLETSKQGDLGGTNKVQKEYHLE